MHVISWNVRGANDSKKKQAIRNLRIKHGMDMVFIQETKIKKLEDSAVDKMWGREKYSWSSVDTEGARGGLLTIWDTSFMDLISEEKGKGFILLHGTVTFNHQKVLLNFLNVYAPNAKKEKLKLWETLVDLKSFYKGEWVLGGDFNSVLQEEERSRSSFNEKDARIFQEFIQAMGILDMPLKGRRFTWSNKNGASRLDRFLISPGVLSLWPKLEQIGLDKGSSDHAAVALVKEEKFWGTKPFRILNVWLEQPGMKALIKDVWKAKEEQGRKGFTLQRRFASVRRMLSQWNKKSFGDIRQKLISVRAEWERLSKEQEARNLSEEEYLKKLALQKRMWQLEAQEERIWRRKSRIKWLQVGDQNTSYFHRMATWRTKRNNISSLEVGENRVEEPEQIKNAVCEYFSEVFRKAVSSQWSLEELNFGSLNENQRKLLESAISEEEILEAVKDCDGNKAPGPDGFNINFFKKFWETVKEEVVGFIKEFWLNGRLLKGINKTHLALIPKTSSPQSLMDYRPISLVNSMYKILAKC
ncbi:hypothetical protein QQ045_024356 [Rhodiola kirilowii]